MSNPLRLKQVKNPLVRYGLRKISKIDLLEEWYDDWLAKDLSIDQNVTGFIDYAINRLDVRADIINEDLLDSIPRTGPVIIVANHPLGGLEGLLLTHILLKIRPDLKVLTNELLRIIPEFQDVFIGVDVLSDNKQHENTKGMRDVTRHLSNDGALLVFPAGTVSRLKLSSMSISDAPWSPLITRLARKFEVPILPVFVEGENSLSFYLSGYIHKRLRTMLLPRVMIKKSGKSILFHIGALIPAIDIKRLTNDKIATYYVRFCCEFLQSNIKNKVADSVMPMTELRQNWSKNIVSDHVRSLDKYLLYSEDKFSLYCVPYEVLGPMTEQLAIERERTFRLVDEGTGRELDQDSFDPHYQHLFLWDSEAEKIAGGYRIGVTEDVIANKGLEGLYSHSLFSYNQKFLEGMGGTIEMGRSFVTEDYQRHPKALDMLWKGIGRFVAQNPQYHTLFGCVSISRQYSPLGSALLTETFLSHYGADDSIQRKVKARKPLSNPDTPWTKSQLKGLSDLPILNKLVGRIDVGKSIPILIRHYLALNGRFISFTVNEGFNYSLDGLIVVDLRNTADRYLKRYMGEEGLEKFKLQQEVQRNMR